ncbi:MAG TPA: CHAD domain-containing protein [Terrimicrobiaceae bacterium]
MSYRLRKKSLPVEVRRVTREELEGVLKEVLTVTPRRRSTAVHEARKHIKKVRALIRLLRRGMGDTFYKQENAALRKAAQRISPIRDAHVHVQTIKKLMARSRAHRGTFKRIYDVMSARLKKVLDDREQSDWSKEVAADIETALCRLKNWSLKGLKTDSLGNGLKAAYKKARRALAIARDDPTDAHLHELRKCVKDLWYDLRLLEGGCPAPIKALTKRMKELGARLGDDHDLGMLLAARTDNPLPGPTEWEALEKTLASHRPQSQRATLRLATKVMARKPRAFTDFVFDSWQTWHCRR